MNNKFSFLTNLNIEEKDIQKFEWGEVHWVHQPIPISANRLLTGLVKILPNAKHENHFHFGEEQVLYVLQGSGIQVINGNKDNISPGMIFHCPPYSEHEVINNGDSDLIFLIVYTPAQLTEIQQNLSIISKINMIDNIDIEILERIQEEVSNLLKLSITILNDRNECVTSIINLNPFCKLCSSRGACKEEINQAVSSPLLKIYRVNICRYNVISFSVPILINTEIVGYVKCGHLVINKPLSIENEIHRMAAEIGLDYNDLMRAYYKIPIVPKSRLFALGECLAIVSKYIAGIVINSIVEKELIEKNNQILEKTQETLFLENALKEANIKLLKSQISSNLKNMNSHDNIFFQSVELSYPFDMEISLENAIQSLDIEQSIKIISKIIEDYQNENFLFKQAREVFDELFAATCRMIYKEIGDIEVLSTLRNQYKDMLYNCVSYYDLSRYSVIIIENCINQLRHFFLKDKISLVEKVNRYIKDNYSKDLTLQTIANIFYVSPNYLSTIFNEKNNMSLTDYINITRVQKAKEYLEESNMKISTISRKVGYNNLSYFSHVFKKIMKCTPKEYRTKKT